MLNMFAVSTYHLSLIVFEIKEGNNSKTVNNIKNLTWDKNDQHIKIYLPCNFEVNLIAHLGVIALLFLVTVAMLVGARHHRTQF
jgi:cadmium resistance protein CadD (predicted permease)